MASLALARSPVHPQGGPVRLRYRAAGEGPPVLLLHGGWGEAAYPWDAAVAALAPAHRAIALDRSGYGGSEGGGELPDGFHRAMAEETLAALDALGVDEVALWGHSDGAVVAAWTALLAPRRVRALVLEAVHLFAAKRGSLPFFRDAVEAPERFGPEVAAALERDHGARWREVLARGGRAWLRLIERGLAEGGDVYGGRLSELAAPTLLLHGRHDPRTEPGELAAVQRALPAARLALVEAGHSPHTSARAGAESVAAAARFLREVWPPSGR
ncbi:alpha/beta fold hydrolase [Anaeromyxobacter diazotrophicus]|uniref:Alpha/beta hydrolase n=1 Tax=Anaeromyxobacter diazotrophicus TaxID=2590199 RepID=A0A7I9VP19_9BACT|nr:alpha/beta fold hydrolase [Anaeromyxobacter diazotrophicus]GEJ58155.1 alpha/beta hydrolase [Anaeromyxobacter diazotrophicus]